MQPIPVKVKNVSVYPYLGVGPVGPVVMPVIEGASGTYAVGTLGLNIFYNLNLSGGKQKGTLQVHDRYIAMGEYEDGSSFTTVWMFCLEADKTPSFGRTITMGKSSSDQAQAEAQPLSVPPYIKLAPLTDITVSQLFPPPAIGQIVLIQGGTGNIIGTRVGTPHLMGVEVNGGKRSNQLHTGMTNIIITGKTKDGQIYTASEQTCISAADPAIFLRTFP